MLLSSNAPQWIYPGAKIDLDFANMRYWGGSASIFGNITSVQAMGSIIFPTSANPATPFAPDNYGVLRRFLQFGTRIAPGTGLWAEGNYTNYALWSRDLTNAAWVATNATVLKNQPSADIGGNGLGTANTASSITATSANGTILQSITLTSRLLVGSAYVKRLIGSGTVQMTIDGTTYTDITSLINSTSYTQVLVPSQTIANPIIGFQLGTNNDSIAVDHSQVENNGYATTPLVTTSSTLSRGADEPAISDPAGTKSGDGNRLIRSIICTDGPWWCVLKNSANQTHTSMIATDGNWAMNGGCNGSGAFMATAAAGNKATTANIGTFGLGNINIAVGRMNGQGTACALNGGAVSKTNTGAALTALGATFTHCGVGNNGAGNIPLDGYISRLTFGIGDLLDGQMIEWSRG